MKTVRADELLVSKGLAETRSKAQALIFSGKVRLSEDDVIDKPSRKVPIDASFIVDSGARFVSRGGEKLEGFLQQFPIDVKGKSILDIGASTGGFTDCLLQKGAANAVCIDVGHGQLHYKLQRDPRVQNFENINAKHLDLDFFNGRIFDIVVCDVSFISLKKILPTIWNFTNRYLIALIKPQFEADKTYMDRCKGVITDPQIQEQIRDNLIQFALDTLPQSNVFGLADSSILGTEGNREFLMGLKKFPTVKREIN